MGAPQTLVRATVKESGLNSEDVSSIGVLVELMVDVIRIVVCMIGMVRGQTKRSAYWPFTEMVGEE